MMFKSILFIGGLLLIIVLFVLQSAFSKPVYNKMSNVWEEDETGRQMSNMMIIGMTIIGFLLGLLVS